MPIIPRGPENPRMNVSSPVPIGSTTDDRLMGDSISQAGKAIADFGENQLNIDRRLRVDEGTNALRNTAIEAENYARMNAAPDGSDYGAKFYEFAQPRVNDIQNKYGGNDPRVREQLSSFVERTKNDIDTTIMVRSAQMMEKNNWNRVESLGNDAANRIRENPNGMLLNAELQAHNQLLSDMASTGGITAENATKAKQAFYSNMSTQLIQGFEDKQQYGKALAYLQANQEDPSMVTSLDPDKAVQMGFIDPREAQSLKDQGKAFEVPVLTKGDKIKLSPEETQVMNGMNPHDKAVWIDRLRSKIKENTDMRLSDLNANINGFEKVALSGLPVNDKQVAELKNQINSNPNLTPFARVRVMDAVNSAYAVNQQLQVAANTPRSEWGNLLSGVDKKIESYSAEASKLDPKMAAASKDFSVQANRLQNKETLERSLAAMKKQQDSDPATFVLQNDKNIQTLFLGAKDNSPDATRSFVNASLAKQQYLGIEPSKQKILMKSEATNLSNSVMAIPNASDTNKYLTNLQIQYGEHFPRVLNEMSAVNKNLNDYKAIAYAPAETREGLIDAIKNEKAIKDAIQTNDMLKIKSKSVTAAATNVMGGFKDVVLGSSNDTSRQEVVNSLNKLVVLQAQRDLVRNPDANPKDLVEKSYGDLVANTYHITNGGNSSVLVPRVVAGRQMDEKIVRSYLDVYSRPENFKDLGIAIPTSMKNNPDQYYSNLSARAKWITNETQTGVRLMEVMRDGTLQPVPNTLGKPIEKNYDEINLRPDKKVIEANKTFFGKLFGG